MGDFAAPCPPPSKTTYLSCPPFTTEWEKFISFPTYDGVKKVLGIMNEKNPKLTSVLIFGTSKEKEQNFCYTLQGLKIDVPGKIDPIIMTTLKSRLEQARN